MKIAETDSNFVFRQNNADAWFENPTSIITRDAQKLKVYQMDSRFLWLYVGYKLQQPSKTMPTRCEHMCAIFADFRMVKPFRMHSTLLTGEILNSVWYVRCVRFVFFSFGKPSFHFAGAIVPIFEGKKNCARFHQLSIESLITRCVAA